MKPIVMSLAALVCAATLSWGAQQQQPQNPANSKQASPSAPKQDVALSAEGEMSRIDSQKQLLWIKTADGTEMQFSYTKDTPVVGGSNSVEGLNDLSGKGTHVKVQYEDKGVAHNATRIEIQPSQS